MLAEVNGSPITQYDVDRAAVAMFGDASKSFDSDARRKLLESLVHSRAIAQAREKEMTGPERAELEAKVAAHREELLVQQYLSRHTHAQGVSGELARRYYSENLGRFGAATVRSYELASATSLGADAAQRALMLGALSDAASKKDWTAWAQSMTAQGKPITVRRGQDDDNLLQPKLRALIAQVKTGEVSKPTIIEGAAYVVRVSSETTKQARPFEEVQDEIARTLAPQQIREAVREASTNVLKSAEVAYR